MNNFDLEASSLIEEDEAAILSAVGSKLDSDKWITNWESVDEYVVVVDSDLCFESHKQSLGVL